MALPPLRERAEDVPALAMRLLSDLAVRLGRPAVSLAPEALARLAEHSFPGNVRELRNVLEKAAVLAPGPVLAEADLDLGERSRRPQHTTAGAELEQLPFADAKRRANADFERSYLGAALARNGGNVSRTAEAIGMVRQSLQQKMRELGLRGDAKGDD